MRILPFSLGLILAATAAATASSAPSRHCVVDHAQYDALRHGMSYTQVRARLGCGGRRISHLAIGRSERATYSWRGHGTYGANLTLTFRDGHLTDKSQLGLRAE